MVGACSKIVDRLKPEPYKIERFRNTGSNSFKEMYNFTALSPYKSF
jgi:hypothetical protein